jgi:hypothetical protein
MAEVMNKFIWLSASHFRKVVWLEILIFTCELYQQVHKDFYWILCYHSYIVN